MSPAAIPGKRDGSTSVILLKKSEFRQPEWLSKRFLVPIGLWPACDESCHRNEGKLRVRINEKGRITITDLLALNFAIT